MASFGLSLQPRGRYTGYNISAHPAVSSEFAVAGFRLHSTIPPVLALRNKDMSNAGSKPLRDAWFQPFDLYGVRRTLSSVLLDYFLLQFRFFLQIFSF